MDWHRGKRTIARSIHLDLTHNQERYAQALAERVSPGTCWLDIGCGHRIVPEWAMSSEKQATLVARAKFLVGVDVDDGIAHHPLLTYRIKAFGGRLPFRDRSFDLITANMVVEHVGEPDEFLFDVNRVLKPGGHFLFVTPNLESPLLTISQLTPEWAKKRIVGYLEQRTEEDIFPAHYRLNRPTDILQAASRTGFDADELRYIGSSGEFDRLGPLSWVECFALKGLEVLFHGRMQPDLLCMLTRKPTAQETARPGNA